MRVWLKKLRDEKGLSQQNLADYLGVTRQYYQQIEAGDRMPKITMEITSKLSKLYNIGLQEIAEMENFKNESED